MVTSTNEKGVSFKHQKMFHLFILFCPSYFLRPSFFFFAICLTFKKLLQRAKILQDNSHFFPFLVFFCDCTRRHSSLLTQKTYIYYKTQCYKHINWMNKIHFWVLFCLPHFWIHLNTTVILFYYIKYMYFT